MLNHIHCFGLRCAAIALMALAIPALAAGQEETKYQFEIPPQALGDALQSFARASRQQVSFDSADVSGRTSAALLGTFTAEQAIRQLLVGSGLELRRGSQGVWMISRTTGADASGISGLRLAHMNEMNSIPSEAQKTEAADSDPKSEGPKAQEITITGSRIKRTDMEGPSPVLTITRQEIDRMGATEVDDVLRKLTVQYAGANENSPRETASPGYNGISLRGLGSQSTLVLINGRRPGNTALISSTGAGVNVNSIPLAAVERIEVLTDGASAIYGTDAIAGVVNFIMKRDFRGSEANVRYGNAFDTDTSEKSAFLTQGFGTERVDGLFTVSVYDRNALRQQDRDFSLDAFQLTMDRGSPATIYSLNGQPLPGVGTTAALVPKNWDNSRPLTPADLIPYTGALSGYGRNQAEFGFLRAPSKREGFMGMLNYDMGRGARLMTEAAITRTASFSELSASGVLRSNAATIGISNPYNPFRGVSAVDFDYTFNNEIGPVIQRSDFSDYRYALGVADIAFLGAKIDVDYTYSHSERVYSSKSVDQNKLLANTVSTDPAVAFNFFSNPYYSVVNTSRQLEGLLGTRTIDTEASQSVATAKGTRELVALPGGKLAMAAGVEFRRETFGQLEQDPTANPPVSSTSLQLNRDVKAVFMEFAVPLVGPQNARTGLQKFELQLAGRYEDYSDFGSTQNPKIAFAWKPIRSLLVRSSYGTGFRSPNAQELDTAAVTTVPTTLNVVDIRRGGATVSVLQSRVAGSLLPEESETTTFGMVWDVPWVRGLSLSADLYRIELERQIRSIPAQEYINSEDFLPGRVIRGPLTAGDQALGYTAGPIQEIRLTAPINVGHSVAQGADFRFSYNKATSVGQFAWNLNATYVDSFRVQVAGAAPFIESAGVGDRFGASGSRFVSNSSLFWHRNILEAGITARYIAPYRFLTPAQRIDSSLEFDVQFSVDGPWLTQWTLGINNVFRSDPPRVRSIAGAFSQPGYDVAYFNGTAGYYYLNLRKSF